MVKSGDETAREIDRVQGGLSSGVREKEEEVGYDERRHVGTFSTSKQDFYPLVRLPYRRGVYIHNRHSVLPSL